MDHEDDDAVGYRKPPKHSRWKKGQSGNPRGRAKGSRGLKTDLDEELKARLAITINGKLVKGTTQQLMLRTLAARAASGDVRASRVLIDLVLQVFGSGDRGGEREQLSSQDQALLELWLGQATPEVQENPSDLPQAKEEGRGSGDRAGSPIASSDNDDGEEDRNGSDT